MHVKANIADNKYFYLLNHIQQAFTAAIVHHFKRKSSKQTAVVALALTPMTLQFKIGYIGNETWRCSGNRQISTQNRQI